MLSKQGVQKGVRFGVPIKKNLSNLGSLEKTLCSTPEKSETRDRKTHKLFQHKLFGPTQNTRFGPPEKSLCASFPGKGRKKGTHINFFGGVFGPQRGSQTGHVRPQKV